MTNGQSANPKKTKLQYLQKLIDLNNLFENNDQLKTNTALQMKDAGMEFKMI